VSKREPFLFERYHQPLASQREFLRRLARSAAVAGVVILVSLGIGVVGYHSLVGLGWLDALLNASMILGGMGPVDPIRSDAGKWFASAYAIFSGIVLLTSVGVLLAPALHRFMHHFHLDEEQ
jgi:hypothetical protein